VKVSFINLLTRDKGTPVSPDVGKCGHPFTLVLYNAPEGKYTIADYVLIPYYPNRFRICTSLAVAKVFLPLKYGVKMIVGFPHPLSVYVSFPHYTYGSAEQYQQNVTKTNGVVLFKKTTTYRNMLCRSLTR